MRYKLNWVNFHNTDIMNAKDLQIVKPHFGNCKSEVTYMHISIHNSNILHSYTKIKTVVSI